jgi:hypothetical protein
MNMIVADKVFKALKKMSSNAFEPASVPAIKLHLYNFFKNHPRTNKKELNKEINKCRRWSEMEKEYRQKNNPLSTIGIEIEIKKSNLTPDKVAVLKRLDIPNYEEYSAPDFEVSQRRWEVNPDFSYSPWMQARVIQELAAMGALPMEETADGRGKRIPARRVLPLHINLGWPKELSYKEKFFPYIEILSDILNYAFNSTKGLRPLEFNSWNVKNSKGGKAFFRLELKVPFRDYPSYRMLAEAQKLGTMLFSCLKKTESLPLSRVEERLADLWLDFSSDVFEQSKNYGIEPGDLDKNREKVIVVLENSDLRQKSRGILSRYARGVGEILKTESDFEKL